VNPEFHPTYDKISSSVRAFLAASEDVDIEPETVEELVQALILETASSSADNESSGIRLSESSPEPDGFDVEVSALDMSALYFFPDQGRCIGFLGVTNLFMSARRGKSLVTTANSRYDTPSKGTRSVARVGLSKLLNRRLGMSSWMNEYVLKRNIPIPQLLVAFGINLVRTNGLRIAHSLILCVSV
jgi:hypothetical protein